MAKRWWEQDGLDLEGMQMAAWEAELTEGGVVDVRDSDIGGINRWEDTVANVILGTDPNSPLATDAVLELHHTIMSMIG